MKHGKRIKAILIPAAAAAAAAAILLTANAALEGNAADIAENYSITITDNDRQTETTVQLTTADPYAAGAVLAQDDNGAITISPAEDGNANIYFFEFTMPLALHNDFGIVGGEDGRLTIVRGAGAKNIEADENEFGIYEKITSIRKHIGGCRIGSHGHFVGGFGERFGQYEFRSSFDTTNMQWTFKGWYSYSELAQLLYDDTTAPSSGFVFTTPRPADTYPEEE